ncbi:MAG: DUF1232 domain-containing protein [Anaerolineaceae bacterium]|nr:DUF1232 domain-containing protein [Anaerolineaceae bacterium]
MNRFQKTIENLKQKARHLKQEAHALLIAYRDPRVPWYAKAIILFVIAHTFSPIDLIPDFIPVLGYLDDLIITPVGIALAIRIIPPEVMEEARAKAASLPESSKPISWIYAGLVIIVWIILLIAIFQWARKIFQG